MGHEPPPSANELGRRVALHVLRQLNHPALFVSCRSQRIENLASSHVRGLPSSRTSMTSGTDALVTQPIISAARREQGVVARCRKHRRVPNQVVALEAAGSNPVIHPTCETWVAQIQSALQWHWHSSLGDPHTGLAFGPLAQLGERL